MTNNSEDFENLLKEYHELKAEHLKQERKLNNMKNYLLNILENNNANIIKTYKYEISRDLRSRESISKKMFHLIFGINIKNQQFLFIKY